MDSLSIHAAEHPNLANTNADTVIFSLGIKTKQLDNAHSFYLTSKCNR